MFRKKFLRVYYEIFLFFYLWFLLFLERVRARVATFTNCAPAMIHHSPLLSSTGNNVFPSAVYFTDVMTSVALGATLSTQCHEAWGEGHRQTDRAVWTKAEPSWRRRRMKEYSDMKNQLCLYVVDTATRRFNHLYVQGHFILGKSVIMRTSEDLLQDFFNSQAAAPSVTSS